ASNGCTASASANVRVLTAPATPLITASSTTICNAGGVLFTLTNPRPGYAIQWQQSPDTINWSNISGANSTTYFTNLSRINFFRVYVICTASDTSAGIKVSIANPTITSMSASSRCGTGPVTFSVSGNGTFDWYANSSGGASLFTGSNFTTVIGITTTYY